MTKGQKNKIINSLKTGRMLGGGQTLNTLAYVSKSWNEEVSKYLQHLKTKGLVYYFSGIRVWYWIKEVKEVEQIECEHKNTEWIPKEEDTNTQEDVWCLDCEESVIDQMEEGGY